MSKYIFSNFPGVDYILTERFTRSFGAIFRTAEQMGGGSTVPDVQRFATNTQSLRVHQEVAIPPKRGAAEDIALL